MNHTPVLVKEVVDYLKPEPNKTVIDATLGFGGHSLELISRGVRVLGIEDDPETFQSFMQSIGSLATEGSKFVSGNFSNIDRIAKESGFESVDGVLFDLGVNTFQLTSEDRGLSFSNSQSDLDMRLRRDEGFLKASDLLNSLRLDQLSNLFREFDIQNFRRLSSMIVERRDKKPFKTVGDLLEVVDRLPKTNKKTNPATKIFMALRIAVNSEIENLKVGLPKAFDLVRPGGRVVVISFHSGEDRVVKDLFNQLKRADKGNLLSKKPTIPTKSEVERNPSSRSAKLRAIEKI